MSGRSDSLKLPDTPRGALVEIGGGDSGTHSRAKTKASYSNSRNTTPTMTPRSWVTYNSPLWRKDKVKSDIELSVSLPTTPRILSRMEMGFVNDAIPTHTFSTRRKPIITPYDARSDKYAQAYFKSPFVQSVMERNRAVTSLKEVKQSRTINKLSVRRRCKQTPNTERIKQRETGFVNDAIITEKKRTKYKDIIPPYNASGDKLCNAYFTRPDVKRLVDKTCAPENRVKIKQKVATA